MMPQDDPPAVLDTIEAPVDEAGQSSVVCEGLCELCAKRPGSMVRTDHREFVLLCSSCQGKQLRRRLPWRRYTSLTVACVAVAVGMVPIVGGWTIGLAALRSGSSPEPAGSLGEVFAQGWAPLTSFAEPWAVVAVIATIALALPVTIVTTTSDGAALAERVRSSKIPNLDDHVRIAHLNSALMAHIVLVIFAAAFALLTAADAALDGAPGWAGVTLCSLILAAVLIVGTARNSMFSAFADHTTLMIKANVADGVSGRRERIRGVSGRRGAVAMVIALALQATGAALALYPSGVGALRGALATAVLGSVCTGLLAWVGCLYLRSGEIPALVITLFYGVVLGMSIGASLLRLAFDAQLHLVAPWGVLLGSGWFVPLFVVIALGLIGAGPLKWLGYFTARTDDLVIKFREIRHQSSHQRPEPDA